MYAPFDLLEWITSISQLRIGPTPWSCRPLGIMPIGRTESRRTSVFTLGGNVVSYTGAGI